MRLIIVSGRSGSGKSTALNVLEDNGFYCIDNLPASLLPDLAQRALLHTELLQPQVAVSIDARNLPSQLQRFPELLQEVRDNHINCDVLYLDAGLEPEVREYLAAQPDVEEMYQDIVGYLNKWLPRFAASNRSYVTVAIGCTGGHHRSVYLAERIGAALRDSLKNVQIRHRDLSS